MESGMTLAQMAKRIEALEKDVRQLSELVDYQQAVEGIRRGLESADRGEGEVAAKAFGRLRRKYKLRKDR
jgi:hypothetical protein